MLMDKMTEMVAHMIGIFHTTLEDERMRDAYQKFKAQKAEEPDNDPLKADGIEFRAKYELEGFTPGLYYADLGPTTPYNDIASPFYAAAEYPLAKLPAIVSAPPDVVTFYAQAWGEGRVMLTLEPASSVVVITHQFSYLSDNDLLLLGDGETVFIDPAEFLTEQLQFETIAQAIASPLKAEMIQPGDNATQDAIALHDQVVNAQASTLAGVSAKMMHGADAFGLHINGELVDEIPSIEDLFPAFKQDDEDEDTDETEAATQSGLDTSGDSFTLSHASEDHEFPDPFEGLDTYDNTIPYFEEADGHNVVMGANTLVNEVVISSAWLDAPVFSVMGDVVNLDVISQINVLVDHDYGSLGEFVASTVMNAASHTVTATTPVPAAGEDSSGQTGDLELPSHWIVTRIDGDLLQINQISQYSFVTDNDRAEIVFDSASTYIGMGDNTVINLTDLAELGYGYDLIMIGGSMISVNWIHQMNVMIDNDTMTFSGEGANSFSGGDNLLFNGATINSTGVDSYGDMQGNFASASADLANGGLTIDESVAHDSVFEGSEILRVLYIEGDMISVNWVEQTNVLGDSDQVNLARDEFEASTGATATVTTGSNSAINLATINEYGTDSTIAVQGEVYDDALLYQAELVDTDADPLGVDMPALAGEAVVFLADDMMSPDVGPSDAPIIATSTESTASSDVMQSMLA